MPPKRTTTPMTDDAIKALIAQGVADALAKYEANRGSGNGDDSHDSRIGRRRQKMEYVFHISNYTVACQIKFATCTLLGNALTWWNSYIKIVGRDVTYGMSWKSLNKMMTDKYCPRSEIKKLEIEICNLKVKGTDVVSYTQRFQELALMCGKMFLAKSDKVEKYVGGLPDMIQGSVIASKQKTMQDAIESANDLMDQKIRTFSERQVKNKRKLDNDNQAQQQSPKKQNLARAYFVGSSEKKESPATTNNQITVTCYECGNQGHYRSDCPELKNRNKGNQTRGTKARGMVYALGGGETDQDHDNMEGDIDA
ncbi:reverse transcriptase domain-containing protein [Tanacetum coccineum]